MELIPKVVIQKTLQNYMHKITRLGLVQQAHNPSNLITISTGGSNNLTGYLIDIYWFSTK
jgi:hypothetical protein